MEAPTPTSRDLTNYIRLALREKFDAQSYALVFEVPNGTGMNKSRSADALAFSLWPSRGLDAHGFEFKASRSDWLRELKNPAKAEAFHQYVDFWHVVAADDKIVLPDELPKGWGLLTLSPDRSRLRAAVKPDRIDAIPWSRSFTAGVMRAATSASMKASQAEINRAVTKALDDDYKRREKRDARTFGDLQEKFAEIEKRVRDFEDQTGLQVGRHQWQISDAKAVKSAVEALSLNIDSQIARHLAELARKTRSIAEESQAAVDSIHEFRRFIEQAKHAAQSHPPASPIDAADPNSPDGSIQQPESPTNHIIGCDCAVCDDTF